MTAVSILITDLLFTVAVYSKEDSNLISLQLLSDSLIYELSLSAHFSVVVMTTNIERSANTSKIRLATY